LTEFSIHLRTLDAHWYGVQPLLAFTTAEYKLLTVTFGSEVVVISTSPKDGCPGGGGGIATISKASGSYSAA
jgi:hypothetical protein